MRARVYFHNAELERPVSHYFSHTLLLWQAEARCKGRSGRLAGPMFAAALQGGGGLRQERDSEA